MSRRIFNFDHDGKTVLGFDTGLNAKAFAQAKLAQLITQSGSIVHPDGKVESWRAEGVTEQDTMIIWGPSFPGELLSDVIINPHYRDEALNAVRFWLKARMMVENNSYESGAPYPGPAGALVMIKKIQDSPYPIGTLFFPPGRLVSRGLDVEGETLNAQAWAHPDLDGGDGISFSAGAMLYSIFCSAPPFKQADTAGSMDELRRDIREGVFVPVNLVAPGLDPEISTLINLAISHKLATNEGAPRPSPQKIIDSIGQPFSKPVSSLFRHLSDEEVSSVRVEQEQFIKKKTREVKTRRFVIRNTAIITVSLIALVVLVLFIRGTVRHRAEMPTTRGMSPIEVIEAYYNAFNDLDHMMMEACVTGRAGKGDIDTVINLFVITRVRQAYEVGQETFLSAQDWVDAGQPGTGSTVFGITDLSVRPLSGNSTEAGFEAFFMLWTPGAELDEELGIVQPLGTATRDVLHLVLEKDLWRITSIDREQSEL